MVTLTIDNRPVTVPEGTTILDAAKTVDIHIPTLCYLREINEVAACRVCAVEVEGVDKLAAACNTQVEDGMVVRTNTQRVRLARKTNVELILSQHDGNCTACVRSGNCSLQALSKAMNIQEVPFRNEATERPWDKTLPILRDSSKCIKCLRCVSVCERVQSLGVWEVTGSGAHTTVRIKGGLRMNEANCALCGQCVSHCPVGALREPGPEPGQGDGKAPGCCHSRHGREARFRHHLLCRPHHSGGEQRVHRALHPFRDQQAAHVHLLLPRLGALPPHGVPRTGGQPLHREKPPADVRCHRQELLRQAPGKGTQRYFLCLRHALCGEKI